jgi:hypothetical protein
LRPTTSSSGAEIAQVVEDARGSRVASGEQRGARGVAKRVLAVGALKSDAPPCQAVYVGDADDGVAIAAQFGPEVVHGDEQNVVVGNGARGGGREAGQEAAARGQM